MNYEKQIKKIEKIESLFENEEQQNDVVYEFLELLCEKLKLKAIKIQDDFPYDETDIYYISNIYYISKKYDHALAGKLAKGYLDLPLSDYNQKKYMKKRMYADIMKNVENQINKTLREMEESEKAYISIKTALYVLQK